MDLRTFINDNGRVSSTKTTEKWVKKNFPDDYIKIKENSSRIGLEGRTFSEKIYHYINHLGSPFKCKNCGLKTPRFFGLLNGYSEYCSSKCSNSSSEVMERKKEKYLEKYGIDNPSKSKEVIEKIKETFESKYGGNPFTLDRFREKIRKTNLEKYGRESAMEAGSSLRDKLDQKVISDFLEKYKDLDVLEFETKKGGNAKLLCRNCGNVFEISKWNLYQRTKKKFSGSSICTVCNPIGQFQKSGLEDFIRSSLKEFGVDFEEKNRKILCGKEIDFYIPNIKIGIEINGIFWHSEKFKHDNYHLEKTEKSIEKGICLIQIFEDEIIHKPEIVRSRIKSLIGINQDKIYSRKCEVRFVSSSESSVFLEENHIQGNVSSKVRIGLFHKNELVSIMTFGNLRKNLGSYSKEGEWELLRFCNKKGTTVIGGASRILKNFIKEYNPNRIISYCDRRWSDGNFYTKIGFNLEGKTRPNYYYTKNGIRENRYKYRKDVLVKDGFDPKLSEREIMSERGFLRIYDCGNFKFSIDLHKKTPS